MFGIGVVSGGDIYVDLLVYCLLLSISLKLGAAFARSYGWQDWAVPKLRFLWPFITLVTLVLAFVLALWLAWFRPPKILGQVVGILLLVSSVGAVFYLVTTQPERRREIKLGGLGAVVALSMMSIGLSAGLCVFYFIATYPFLIALFLLVLYSTRFNQENSGAT